MNKINLSHKNNFNLLRLIGAILVIVSHSFELIQSNYLEPIGYFTKDKLQCSGVGLTIFFFISGYFITGSALMSSSKGEFILKRIRRIYPALIVLVVISVFIAGPILTISPLKVYFSESDTWLYLYTATGLKIRMYLPGVFTLPHFKINSFNASIWTIALEIKLYTSMVFFLTIGLKKYSKTFAVIFILISIFCIGTVALFPDLNFNILRHLNLIAIFYFGSFVYISSISKKKMKIILLLLFALIILIKIYSINKFEFYGLSLIVICIIIFIVGTTKNIIIPITTDISYGMYIFAFPIQQMVVMFTAINNPWLIVLYSLLITVPVAYLSWHLVEKRFMNYKF